MNRKEFFGVFPYLVSPVDSDGKVKEDVLRSLVDHLIKSGVHGLTPLGSTGEYAYLTWPQRRKVVEIVIDVGDLQIGPKSDILGQASLGIRANHRPCSPTGV